MLQNNTLILLDTLQARIGTIQRGNIIVYIHEDRTPKIKRVLGIEKEVLVIRDGGIYLNEKKISEPYLNQNIRTCVPGSCTDLSPKIFTVPKNAYFILGDNRENSRDSR
jgi:signal peptidase I